MACDPHIGICRNNIGSTVAAASTPPHSAPGTPGDRAVDELLSHQFRLAMDFHQSHRHAANRDFRRIGKNSILAKNLEAFEKAAQGTVGD